MKTDLYHSKIKKSNSSSNNEQINPKALAPLLGFKMHLAESWPEIEDDIEIGFIQGTNGSEICFSHSLGWENEDWLSFVRNGIALPRALESCKKYGIKKFVFYCNNEIMEIKLDELKMFHQ